MEKLKQNLLLLFAFSVPFHQKGSTIVLLVLFIVGLFTIRKKHFKRPSSFYFPLALYALIAISLLYSAAFETRYLIQRASLVAFPGIFIGSMLTANFRKKVFISFMWGTVLAIVICNLMAVYHSFSYVDGKINFSAVINPEQSFLYAVVRDGNYFFSEWFSVFHDTIYFALYVSLSMAILLNYELLKKGKRYWMVLLLFLATIFQLSSKLGLFVGILLILTFLFLSTKGRKQRFIFIGATIFLAGTLLFLNPRSKIMLKKLVDSGLKINPNERYGFNLRLMSWNAAKKVIIENTIVGVGVADTQLEMDKQYKKLGYKTPLKFELNAHNQFLQTQMVCGILGTLVLLGMFVAMFKSAIVGSKDEVFLLIAITSVFLVNFLFESMINRYSGISSFMFFYFLVIGLSTKEKQIP